MSVVEFCFFRGHIDGTVSWTRVFVASATSRYHTIYHVSILTWGFAIIRFGVGRHVLEHNL